MAASFDKGKTWAPTTALGKDLGITTSRFPVAIAGDNGRAAVAFLGAKADGDPSDAPDATDPGVKAYTGSWNLYISYTFDGGKTWKTYDAFPTDPIQRGPVCTRGTTCLAGRNLLDFNDMELDGEGRVLIALADGALKPGDDYTKDLSKGTIVRQVGGPSLYAAAAAPPVVAAPGRPTTPTAPNAPNAPAGAGAGGSLAATGLATLAPVSGFALLLIAFGIRRRRA